MAAVKQLPACTLMLFNSHCGPRHPTICRNNAEYHLCVHGQCHEKSVAFSRAAVVPIAIMAEELLHKSMVSSTNSPHIARCSMIKCAGEVCPSSKGMCKAKEGGRRLAVLTWMATLAASRTCRELATRRTRTRWCPSKVSSRSCCEVTILGGGARSRVMRAGSTAPSAPRHSAHACCAFLPAAP